jgi:hypothetical protein
MHDRRLGLAGIAAATPAGIIAGLLAAPHDHSATLLIGGLAGIAAFYLVFANLMTWVSAGVVYSARYPSARPSVTVDTAIAHA